MMFLKSDDHAPTKQIECHTYNTDHKNHHLIIVLVVVNLMRGLLILS